MNVLIKSRKDMEELLKSDFPENAAVISFYNPPGALSENADFPVDYSAKTDRVCRAAIHDIDKSVLPKYQLTYETYFPEAEEMAAFIYQAKEDGCDIICQCEYGESRSSACAAAILEHFEKNGISIFTDYRYYPNQMVYHKVVEALENYKKERVKKEDDAMGEYKCSIEHFLEDEYSICREERQYAVFLYDILRKYKDPEMDERTKEDGDVFKIFDACSIPPKAKIEHVFYEPTFMRDFFERNRRNVLGKNKKTLLQMTFSPSDYKIQNQDDSFNYQLMKYVCEKVCGISISDKKPWNLEEYNLGGSNSGEFKQKEKESICKMTGEEFQEKAGVIQDRIRQMMNAKSDIAVIYSKEEKNELLFLECKFESGVSAYKGCESEESNEKVTQIDIQWLVADFLCGYLNEKGDRKEDSIEVADAMKDKKKSCLVKFVREKDPNKTQEIAIEKLIAYSYWI